MVLDEQAMIDIAIKLTAIQIENTYPEILNDEGICELTVQYFAKTLRYLEQIDLEKDV